MENLCEMLRLRCCGQFGDVSVVQKTFEWHFVVSLSLGLQTDILEPERGFHCQEIEREMWLLAVTLYIMLDAAFYDIKK